MLNKQHTVSSWIFLQSVFYIVSVAVAIRDTTDILRLTMGKRDGFRGELRTGPSPFKRSKRCSCVFTHSFVRGTSARCPVTLASRPWWAFSVPTDLFSGFCSATYRHRRSGNNPRGGKKNKKLIIINARKIYDNYLFETYHIVLVRYLLSSLTNL